MSVDEAAGVERVLRPGPDSTLADVREELIETASQMLFDSGLEFSAAHIKLRDVIAASGVSRATAYRSLGNQDEEPQDELHRLALARVLTCASAASSHQEVTDAVSRVLAEHGKDLTSGDPERVAPALQQLVRAAAGASYRMVADSAERSILMSAYGSIKSQVDLGRADETDWQWRDLRSGKSGLLALFVELYEGLTALAGLKVRPGRTMEQFATAGAGLVEGLAMRSHVNPHVDGIVLPTGPKGEDQEWTLFALGFEGLIHAFLEF